MKKLFFIATLAFCAAAFAVEATVVSVTGKVEMQEGSSWIALQKGDKVEKGAVISTGFKSEAVLEFKGTKFTLGALTRVTVEDLVEGSGKDSTNLFIDSGKISANVNGADGNRVGFKVRSPIATASVRGTAFVFSANGELSVNRGVVSFSSDSSGDSDKGGVLVAANQQSKANDVSGVCSSPAQEKAQAAAGGSNSTTTLTADEAVATAASGVLPGSGLDDMFTDSGDATAATATLNITLDFN